MRASNRNFRFLFGAVLLAWCAGASGFAISLLPASGSHQVGAPFALNVVMSGLKTINSEILSTYDFDVLFDASKLQLTSTTESNALCDQLADGLNCQGLSSLFSASPIAGGVNLFDLSFASDVQLASQQGDPFTIATLNFLGLVTGTRVPISFGTINALGGLTPPPGTATDNLLLLNPTFDGATVTITAPSAVPEPTSLLLVGLGMFLLAQQRRRHSR